MGYQNPGQLFVTRYGAPDKGEDVLAYVQFLRDESGLGSEPPIDLDMIYARFGLMQPKRVPLPNLQGLLVDPEYGLILVNQADPPQRQRFTESHELVELLFAALPPNNGWAARERVGPFKMSLKEELCNEGAAELLMPRSSFLPRVRQAGVSYATARQLAFKYQVSTTAALVQMTRIGPGSHAVVLWRRMHKPAELRAPTSENQPALFADLAIDAPHPKLRVLWCLAGPRTRFIPRDKSVPDDSSIGRSYFEGVFVRGDDVLELGTAKGRFHCESQPFEVEDERQVLSLLHLPGDTCTTRMDTQTSTLSLLTFDSAENR